jgi:hypothetical protein
MATQRKQQQVQTKQQPKPATNEAAARLFLTGFVCLCLGLGIGYLVGKQSSGGSGPAASIPYPTQTAAPAKGQPPMQNPAIAAQNEASLRALLMTNPKRTTWLRQNRPNPLLHRSKQLHQRVRRHLQQWSVHRPLRRELNGLPRRLHNEKARPNQLRTSARKMCVLKWIWFKTTRFYLGTTRTGLLERGFLKGRLQQKRPRCNRKCNDPDRHGAS